jgi:hypothetical protein
LHKNLYLGLCYLHAILDGRRAYGTLGWNLRVFEFDQNDFDISDSIVNSYMVQRHDDNKMLKVLKYIFGTINFAGKLNR